MCVHILTLLNHPLKRLSFHPSRLSQSTRLDTLCYITASHQLLYLWYSLNLSHLPLHLHLYSSPVNRFISTIFLEALFTITRTWRQSICSLTNEWIDVVGHIYIGYYSAIKKGTNLSQLK